MGSKTSKRGKPQRFSRLELRILEVLWARGPVAIREMQAALNGAKPPAYTTVQTTVYRLEAKGAVRRVSKIGKAHVFEAVVARQVAHRRLMDELLALLGGRTQPIMAHWIETGQLTREDLEAAEADLRKREREERS